jgi:MFS family permease
VTDTVKPIEIESVGRWASLSIPAYRWLWGGAAASFLSVQTMFVARGWLAWQLTGQNLALGGVYLVFGVVMLVGMPLGGVATDRVPKRLLLTVATGVMTVTQSVMAILIATGVVHYWMLLLTAVAEGLAFSLIAPARVAMAGVTVGPRLMSNAIVLQQIAMNTTRIFGPALAGAILGFYGDDDLTGITTIYAVAAAVMVIAFVSTFFLPPGLPTGESGHSPLEELRGGVQHVRSNPRLLGLVVVSLLVTMIAFPYVALLAAYADEALAIGGDGFGRLMAVSAIGGVGAAVFSADRADGPGANRLQTGFGFGFGAGLVFLSMAPSFPVALVAMVVLGLSATGFQALNNTLALSYAEPAFHGRVQGLLMMSFGAFGIAALPLGAIADVVGIRQTIWGMGLVAMGVMAGYVLYRRRLGDD